MTDKDRRRSKVWVRDFKYHEQNEGADAMINMVVGTGRSDIRLEDEIDLKAFCQHDADWLVDEFAKVFADAFHHDKDEFTSWRMENDDYGNRIIRIESWIHLTEGG